MSSESFSNSGSWEGAAEISFNVHVFGTENQISKLIWMSLKFNPIMHNVAKWSDSL